MTSIQHTQSTSFHSIREIAQTMIAALMRLKVARRNRRTVVKLADLDDHALRDLGLTRHEVETALATPFSSDPSYRLEQTAMNRRWPH